MQLIDPALGGVVCAGLVTALVIRALIPRAPAFGLIDHPVGRKDHDAAIPVVGGIGIWCGLFAGLVVSGGLDRGGLGLLVGGLLVIVLGVVDDRRDLPWRLRIVAQAFAAIALAVIGGVVLHRLGVPSRLMSLELGSASMPVTVFAVVGLINATNMVDGVDGLAGSLGLSSLAMMIVACFLGGGSASLGVELLVCAGALAAFLALNLRFPGRARALTFLGNSGSALLGMLLAWAAISLTQGAESTVTPALGPWLVALPLLDCLTLIVRRRLEGRSPFAADRGHFHHLLLDRGWSVAQVVSGACALQAAIALLGWALHAAGLADILLIAGFIGLIGCHYWVTGVLWVRTRAAHARMPIVSSQ